MNFPQLEKVNRHREYDTYSSVIKAKVIYSYLFEGLSHRILDGQIIGLDSDESRGWQSMGILHFLGLKNNHKNIFHNIGLDTAISYLIQLENQDTQLIATYLQQYKSVENKILDKDTFERNFEFEIAQSKQQNHENRLERLKRNQNTKLEKVEVISIAFKRNADVVATVLERANGICEYCKEDAPFLRAKDNTPYLEVHHMIRLADGGEDNIENAIAVCPNCHRKLHFG